MHTPITMRLPNIALLPACLLIACLAGGCTSPAHGKGDRPAAPIGGVGPEVYQAALPGVVRVEAGLHRGAAFAISDTELITAAHVVRDAYTIDVVLAGDGGRRSAQLVGYDESLDLALLSVKRSDKLRPLKLASQPVLQPGAEVWTIGHPGSQSWAINKGVVSSTEPDGDLITSLHVARGSSGGPVLVYHGDGEVEVVGIVSRILGQGDGDTSGAIPAATIAARIDGLRKGEKHGWSSAGGYVETVHNRSPLVHQVVLARHLELGVSEKLERIYDTLTVPAFPATETLELRSTWRYFFAGVHTYRYEVVRIEKDGSLDSIHEGPLRTFTLDDDRDSFVHNVAIDIDFPEAGEYMVLVSTDGGTSAVVPLRIAGDAPDTSALNARVSALTFEHAPLYHALIVARDIHGSDGTESGPATGNEPITSREVPAPISIEGTFNTVRLDQFPMVVRFHTWIRWGYRFAGEHKFGLALVDAAGRPVASGGFVPDASGSLPVLEGAAGETYTFSLADETSSFQHVSWWEVEFESTGLYFVLCYTDGTITRALPIWVEDV